MSPDQKTRKTIGFMVDGYGPDDFVDAANAFLDRHDDHDVVAFVTNHVRPKHYPNFAVMSINEAFSFGGPVVATSFALARKLIGFPGPRRKFYYTADGTKWGHRRYEDNLDVYFNPEIGLIAPTEEQKRLLESCWNRKAVALIKNFNMEEFFAHA